MSALDGVLMMPMTFAVVDSYDAEHPFVRALFFNKDEANRYMVALARRESYHVLKLVEVPDMLDS